MRGMRSAYGKILKNIKTKSGFTIIELIVVIVIIAILAAISIVAYGGIKDRAVAAKGETAINQYHKALLMYAELHGKYPNTKSYSCLGTIQQTQANSCSSGEASFYDEEMLTSLQEVMNPLPEVDDARRQFSSSSTRGGVVFSKINNATIDGQPHKYFIVYYLPKSTDCKLQGGSLSQLESWPNFSSTKAKYLGRTGSLTSCILPLPDVD